MSAPRVIDASDLALAAQTAARQIRLHRMGVRFNEYRFAALSNCGPFSHCRFRLDPEDIKTMGNQPPMFGPMEHGGIRHVVERVRMTKGAPAVKRVFGTGYRHLMAEISASACMRREYAK